MIKQKNSPAVKRSVVHMLVTPLLAVWMAGCMVASAGLVLYDDDADSMHVMGYPADMPATPALLLRADQLYGWNKISYDSGQNRYILDASLAIGFNDGSETCFQVGGAAAPGETLLVRGNVVVYPCHIKGQNITLPPRITSPGLNRLMLGSSAGGSYGGTVLIESSTHAAHTLYVGFVPPGKSGQTRSGPGAELHAFNSRIAAAHSTLEAAMSTTNARRSGGTPGVRLGSDPVLVNSTVAWADGYILASLSRHARVEGTTFEYSQSGIYNCWSVNPVVGCTFRNMDSAVRDGGSIALTMIDCVFENNNHNWRLTHSDRGLTLIDCSWDPPAEGDVLRAWDNSHTGKRQYPYVVSRRHIVLAVVDSKDRPVTNAVISVENEQGESAAAEPPRLRSDCRGQTPGKNEKGALQLKEFVRRATDNENEPATVEYTYKITIKTDRFTDKVITGFRPEESWKVFRVKLEL